MCLVLKISKHEQHRLLPGALIEDTREAEHETQNTLNVMMQKLFLLIQQFGQRCLKEQTCRNGGERVAQLLGLTQWSGKRPRQIHTRHS